MNIINRFSRLYPSDRGFVFKSCLKKWIVVLHKLTDTITNESRSNAKDLMYAKFRANKLLVVCVVNKFTQKSIDNITNSVHKEKTIIYKKGEIIEVNDFDENLENICAPGIHYFKSPEAAFYYEIPNNYFGLYKLWYGSGQLGVECTYKNGTKDGLYQLWNPDGQLRFKYAYKDGKIDGLLKKWYYNGQLEIECTFKDGKEDGLFKKWYYNGKLEIECTFKDGKEDGLYKEWYDNGQLKEECTYKDGKKDGLCKEWYENGQLKAIN
jgi:antitoxin component YwqK of YwqJK toxin-antitoxin module